MREAKSKNLEQCFSETLDERVRFDSHYIENPDNGKILQGFKKPERVELIR